MISTAAVDTDAEIPIRMDSFTDATTDLMARRQQQTSLDWAMTQLRADIARHPISIMFRSLRDHFRIVQ
jgi:hypothetical protein